MSFNNQKGKAPVSPDDSVEYAPLTAGRSSGGDETSTTEASGGNFDRVASSASSLFQSLLRPTASEASGVVQTAQQSKGQASATTGTGGSQYYWEEASSAPRHHVQPFRELSDGQSSMDFRSIPDTSMTSTDREFQRFSSELPQFTSATASSEIIESLQNPIPQEDILQLLSSPILTEAIWDPVPFSPPESVLTEAYRPNLQDPRFTEFLASEDLVEFLSREGTVYTEEVWGNMLGLLQQSRKEVEESKRKGKGPSENGNAIERLKVIQGQLRSKL